MSIQVIFQKPKHAKRAAPHYPSEFCQIAKHPLAHGVSLPAHIDIQSEDLVQAALEVGYGPEEYLDDILVLSPADVKAFTAHCRQRLGWLLSGIKIKGGVISRRSFKAVTESSETTTESYYFGMIFGYLAFKAWLPPGRTLQCALHLSTFTTGALIKAGRRYRVLTSGSKSPDLLCQDDAGQWHIVEAKGGGETYRWGAVRDGMSQLDGISWILDYASGVGQLAPKSSICSFIQTYTTKDASAAWELWIVDPAPKRPSALVFNASLAELKLIATQEMLISAWPSAKKRPVLEDLALKKTPVPGVYIQPMDSELPHQYLRTQLARFDQLQRLVLRGDEPLRAVTNPSIPLLALVSELIREHLQADELERLETLMELHLVEIYKGDAMPRALVLARLLFAVLELDQLLERWRARRQAIYVATRERVLAWRQGDAVSIRTLTCGAIVLGFRGAAAVLPAQE